MDNTGKKSSECGIGLQGYNKGPPSPRLEKLLKSCLARGPVRRHIADWPSHAGATKPARQTGNHRWSTVWLPMSHSLHILHGLFKACLKCSLDIKVGTIRKCFILPAKGEHGNAQKSAQVIDAKRLAEQVEH